MLETLILQLTTLVTGLVLMFSPVVELGNVKTAEQIIRQDQDDCLSSTGKYCQVKKTGGKGQLKTQLKGGFYTVTEFVLPDGAAGYKVKESRVDKDGITEIKEYGSHMTTIDWKSQHEGEVATTTP